MSHFFKIHLTWGFVAVATFTLGLYYSRFRGSQNPPGRDRTIHEMAMAEQSLPLGTLPPSSKNTSKNADADGETRAVMSREAIEAMAKAALTDPNPVTRELAFANLLQSMTPENVSMVMDALKTNRADGDQWRLFLYAWGAMDGRGALAHAATLAGREKARFLSGTIPGWAGKDPHAAIAWLDTMEEGDEKKRYRGGLINGLADHDIGMATAYVLDRSKAGDKEAAGYMEIVAGEEIRKKGAAGATAWAEALPDGGLKGEALRQIADEFVGENPSAAGAWAAKFATARYGVGIIEEVGEEWAERDPKATTAWLATLSEGKGRSEGSYAALREWTRRDAVAASKYLDGMPSSSAKDSAVSGFARSLAREDPEAAVIWARTITDEKSRIQTLTRAGQSWLRRDPVALTNWLQTANLPEAARQAILNPPKD